MQPDNDPPSDEPIGHAPGQAFRVSAEAITTAPVSDRDQDALMCLLDNCVEAMRLLQTRMADLETKARRAVEASVRERSEARADIATLRTRTKLTESSVDQMHIRLGAIESGAGEVAAAHARDIQTVRADADVWRTQAQNGIARLTAMDDRLTELEGGLARRLQQSESELADARQHAESMEERAIRSEETAADLGSKLTDAVSAVADQRARMACLQAKLRAATQAARYADETAALSPIGGVAIADDVIDLLDHAEDWRHSAA